MATNSLFFIIGVPRSGTTLLSVLLNNHSRIFIDKEAIAIRTLDFNIRVEQSIELPGGRKERWLMAADKDERLMRFLDWENIDSDPPDSLADFVADSFANRARSNGKEIFGDKSPDAIARLPELLSLFPDAKILHVVRDARPNVASLVRRQYLHPKTGAQLWKDWNKMGMAAEEWLGEERVLKVKYEDLLTDPTLQLQRICQLIGVTYEAGMLDLGAAKATQAKDAYVKKKIDVASINRWRQEMTDEEITNIEKLTADLMLKLGYQPVNDFHGQSRNLTYTQRWWYGLVNKSRLLFQPERKHMKDRRLIDVRIPLSKRLFDFAGALLGGLFSKDLLRSLISKN